MVGKAVANGFPLAAVGGAGAVMEAVSRTWISSTTATELVSLAACDATLEVLARERVPARLEQLGAPLLAGLRELAERHPAAVERAIGIPEMCALTFRSAAAGAQVAAACARHGILFKRSAYNFVSAAHDAADVTRLLDVLRDVLPAVG
jgi:glutamate-1-semialdehyde 2,1-aminomutase